MTPLKVMFKLHVLLKYADTENVVDEGFSIYYLL